MADTNKIDIEVYRFIIETLTSSDNAESMAAQVIQLLISAMGIKGASIFILNPAAGELEILATEGLSVDYVNKGPILVDQSIQLPSNRETVIISDVKGSDQLQYPDKAETEGIRSIISLPMKLRGKTIGALRLYGGEVWTVTPRDRHLMESLAMNLTMALRYFRVATTLVEVRDTLGEIHPVWL